MSYPWNFIELLLERFLYAAVCMLTAYTTPECINTCMYVCLLMTQ